MLPRIILVQLLDRTIVGLTASRIPSTLWWLSSVPQRYTTLDQTAVSCNPAVLRRFLSLEPTTARRRLESVMVEDLIAWQAREISCVTSSHYMFIQEALMGEYLHVDPWAPYQSINDKGSAVSIGCVPCVLRSSCTPSCILNSRAYLKTCRVQHHRIVGGSASFRSILK